MSDIATLGLEVRSEQAAKGSSELDKLTNAAKRAQAAATGVSASTKNAGQAAVSLSASAGRAATALNSAAAAAQKAANAMQVHSKAVNDNTMRVNRMGGSMSGLAAQFQDIDGTAAMGMEAMSGAKRLDDLPDETKEFLVNLRPDEVKTLSEGIRLVGPFIRSPPSSNG